MNVDQQSELDDLSRMSAVRISRNQHLELEYDKNSQNSNSQRISGLAIYSRHLGLDDAHRRGRRRYQDCNG